MSSAFLVMIFLFPSLFCEALGFRFLCALVFLWFIPSGFCNKGLFLLCVTQSLPKNKNSELRCSYSRMWILSCFLMIALDLTWILFGISGLSIWISVNEIIFGSERTLGVAWVVPLSPRQPRVLRVHLRVWISFITYKRQSQRTSANRVYSC